MNERKDHSRLIIIVGIILIACLIAFGSVLIINNVKNTNKYKYDQPTEIINESAHGSNSITDELPMEETTIVDETFSEEKHTTEAESSIVESKTNVEDIYPISFENIFEAEAKLGYDTKLTKTIDEYNCIDIAVLDSHTISVDYDDFIVVQSDEVNKDISNDAKIYNYSNIIEKARFDGDDKESIHRIIYTDETYSYAILSDAGISEDTGKFILATISNFKDANSTASTNNKEKATPADLRDRFGNLLNVFSDEQLEFIIEKYDWTKEAIKSIDTAKIRDYIIDFGRIIAEEFNKHVTIH